MIAGVFSALFESAPKTLFRRNEIPADSRGCVEELLRSGLVRRSGAAQSVVCADCGDPHFIPVEWGESSDCAQSYCAAGAGWSEIASGDLDCFYFDHWELALVIARALGSPASPEVFVDGVCWRLPNATIENEKIIVLLAREMNDPRQLMEVARRVQERFVKWPGLVLGGVAPLVDLGLLPHRFRSALLSDIFSWDSAFGPSVARAHIAEQLGLIRPGRGAHGAPRDHPLLAARIDARVRDNECCDQAAAEADALLKDPTWASEGQPKPARENLRRYVSRKWSRLGRTSSKRS